MPLRQVLRSWLVRQPNRGDWLIIGSAAVTTLTALPLAGLYVVVIAPLLLLPFGLMWILRPILGELGWPATAIAVTAVGVAVLGCLAYLNAYFWPSKSYAAIHWGLLSLVRFKHQHSSN